MKFFPSRTTFVQLGPLTIQWYAVCILTGVFFAYYFSKKNLKKYKNIEINEFFDSIFIIAVWCAIIGARAWYVIFDPNFDYIANPGQIIRIWDGGIAIHGALLGGALACYYYCKKKNVPFIKFADAVLPTVFIGQAFGRWGNFVNQECYGAIVDESYYNGILSFIKDSMYINGAYREPMFLYESVLCLIGFFLVNFLLRKYQQKRGDLAYAYLIWYGVIRFFIEAHRTDSLMLKGLPIKTAQLTSICYVIIGLLGFIGILDKYLFKKKKPTVIFDLDGTLQDSEAVIIRSFMGLYEKHDKAENFTEEKQVSVLGPSLEESMSKLFPDLDSKMLIDEYRENFKKYQNEMLKPLDGAVELCKTLKENGYTVGIVTTRKRPSTEECLKIVGLAEYIDDYCCGDEVEHQKPAIDGYDMIINRNNWNKADIVVVGDSVADVNGGKNYGAYTIAYPSNPKKRETLENANPNAIVNSLNEVYDLINQEHNFTYDLK